MKRAQKRRKKNNRTSSLLFSSLLFSRGCRDPISQQIHLNRIDFPLALDARPRSRHSPPPIYPCSSQLHTELCGKHPVFLPKGASSPGAAGAGGLLQGMLDGVALRGREVNGIAASSSGSSPDPSPSPSASGCAVGVGSIEHCVSKMDTLAGIAIKYGVEVADIKRMNGLVTDLQMFAHEKLQIPLPGRHPPSPILLKGSSSNGEYAPRNRQHHSDILESFQSLQLNTSNQRASPAMSILQGYYGLTPPKKSVAAEGTELTLFRTNRTFNFEDEVLPRVSPLSRSLGNGSSPGNGMLAKDAIVTEVQENGEADISSTEKSVRRRQKNDADSIIVGDSSGRAGKGLAPRPKSGSRTDLDSAHTNTLIIGDSFMADGFMSVRKSSSTSNLQEPTTKRTTKPDAISRPIFDGLPKPLTSRRNKAALD